MNTSPRPRRNLLPLAALVLALLGVSLTALTWSNLSSQRELIDQHVLFAARTVLRGVENNLMRAMPMFGRMPREAVEKRIQEYFREMAESGDVLYFGLYDVHGQPMITSQPDGAPRPVMDQLVLADLAVSGEWFGSFPLGGMTSLGYASTLRPEMGRFWPKGQQDGQDQAAHAPEYFLVGLSLDEHYAQYQNFKRTAMLQTGFVLAAAAFVWALMLAYLRRKEQGQRLVRLESFHSTLLEAMPEGLLTIGPDGMVRAANKAARNILGQGLDGVDHAPTERPAQVSPPSDTPDTQPACAPQTPPDGGAPPGEGHAPPPDDHAPPRDGGAPPQEAHPPEAGPQRFGLALPPPIRQVLAECRQGGQAACGWRQLEFGGKSLEVLVTPLGQETMALVRDRTALRSLEKNLEESRRLAAIGSLAAGVAHEIRNPLSSLRGFAQLFASKLQGRQPEESYAQTMVREADRLDRVVTGLLYLARPRPTVPVPVDLAALAEELERLMHFDLERAHAAWRTELNAPEVMADADGLKQALINLILNSLAALPEEGGALTLKSRRTSRGVALTIADNGRGMTDEERLRALEPFFTTRKDGSGLGLSIVHKIARDHGAELGIWSETGKGTAVTLEFDA